MGSLRAQSLVHKTCYQYCWQLGYQTTCGCHRDGHGGDDRHVGDGACDARGVQLHRHQIHLNHLNHFCDAHGDHDVYGDGRMGTKQFTRRKRIQEGQELQASFVN